VLFFLYTWKMLLKKTLNKTMIIISYIFFASYFIRPAFMVRSLLIVITKDRRFTDTGRKKRWQQNISKFLYKASGEDINSPGDSGGLIMRPMRSSWRRNWLYKQNGDILNKVWGVFHGKCTREKNVDEKPQAKRT
jgi:hypothetical protein